MIGVGAVGVLRRLPPDGAARSAARRTAAARHDARRGGAPSLGACLGLGLLLIADAACCAARRPSLDSRVLPYVRDVPLVAADWRPRQRPTAPAMRCVALARPFVAAQRGNGSSGSSAAARRSSADWLGPGRPMTVEQFRISQVVVGSGGLRRRARCRAARAGSISRATRCPGWSSRWRRGFVAILARDSVAEPAGTAARGAGAGRVPARR